MNKEPAIVDLFCGCGGFGLGAELAGFKSIAAVDIESTLQSAYARNFPKAQVVNGDLSKMEAEDWRMLLNGQQVDGVIGGPPCQGYSRMGHSDKADPRRSLLKHFFRTVNIISPKFFVMENVEGLMDEKNVYELRSALKVLDKSYTVLNPMIVNAHDYGAPTKRKRVIVVGYKPEYLARLDVADFIPTNVERNTVRDAIYDLPSPIYATQLPDADDYAWNKYRKVSGLSNYALAMRELPPQNLGWDVSVRELKNQRVSGFLNTKHTEAVLNRYALVEQGLVDKTSRAKRLSWDGVCPTLRAGTGSDKGSHQAVRPLHPTENRVITVREAARLQGFPDWFVFHNTKWHSFRMIGNSVSPLVSKYILRTIKEKILPKKLEKTG
ncbi:DNA cytosine methyltransferase [Shewanella xiamenensis]|uniref:DNA cytosine methyltransferase n=1 Tax=Shewanella xiamenensis TaxID=332186 RepID=UPI000DB7B547|nr:DNA cytosine methyltransferase [Shewanella xiamenensis]MCT8865128.1 DNA cytosine methyltransferase [Shewanella xiamenensis]MCT8877883.1 DNA cytosine methyltransferase [Shewanella xiamenensis]PZP37339.1 MAG: DNA (cytosine-5-)-methyltransferase [Shewanella oneidensis]